MGAFWQTPAYAAKTAQTATSGNPQVSAAATTDGVVITITNLGVAPTAAALVSSIHSAIAAGLLVSDGGSLELPGGNT